MRPIKKPPVKDREHECAELLTDMLKQRSFESLEVAEAVLDTAETALCRRVGCEGYDVEADLKHVSETEAIMSVKVTDNAQNGSPILDRAIKFVRPVIDGQSADHWVSVAEGDGRPAETFVTQVPQSKVMAKDRCWHAGVEVDLSAAE